MAATNACIVGIGQTDLSRDSGRSTTMLAYQAVAHAAADAGIELREIDGLVPYPMGPTIEDLVPLLGTRDLTFTATAQMGGASSLAGLRLGALAVESGAARYVAVFISRNGRSGAGIDQRVRQLAGQTYRQELEYVHGMNTPAQWYSLICRRHMHEYGTTREALGTVALTMRRNAQRNPAAQMYGRELSMHEYLTSPVIADPYLKLDCCLETDGAAAVLLAREDIGGNRSSNPLVRVAAAAEGHPESADDIASRRDFFDTGLVHAAPRAFAAAGLTPADVDVAMIYDCFTFEVIHQLEDAGFCPRGEGGPFVLDGHIAADGSLPVNPHGGLLSEGHLAGMNHIVEAVRQLRGAAGERQVPDCHVAAVTGWGDLGDGAIALLTTQGAAR